MLIKKNMSVIFFDLQHISSLRGETVPTVPLLVLSQKTKNH